MFPYDVIDLTHPLDEHAVSWSGGCGFRSEVKLDYDPCDHGVSFRVQQLKLHAGIGTHIDAPSHCDRHGLCVADLQPSCWSVPWVKIDSTGADAEYQLSRADIDAHERLHGPLVPGQFVMIHTGWDRFWGQPKAYHNDYRFPSVGLDAAQILKEAGAVGLGIDTLSPDRPDRGFAVHQLFLGSGLYLVENVANASQMPAVDAWVMVAPMKLKGVTEAPVRMVGLLPR